MCFIINKNLDNTKIIILLEKLFRSDLNLFTLQAKPVQKFSFSRSFKNCSNYRFFQLFLSKLLISKFLKYSKVFGNPDNIIINFQLNQKNTQHFYGKFCLFIFNNNILATNIVKH